MGGGGAVLSIDPAESGSVAGSGAAGAAVLSAPSAAFLRQSPCLPAPSSFHSVALANIHARATALSWSHTHSLYLISHSSTLLTHSFIHPFSLAQSLTQPINQSIIHPIISFTYSPKHPTTQLDVCPILFTLLLVRG